MRLTDAEAEKLVDALTFYACPGVYFGVGIWGDPPTGGFDQDVSDDHGHPHLDRPVPGALARQVLDELGIDYDREVWMASEVLNPDT